MNKVFIPTNQPEDWKQLLAVPEKQWRSGYSAKTLAYCWLEADGLPDCVRRVFAKSELPLFTNIELLLALPEHQVSLPPYGSHPSQNDLFAIARGNNQLISITVEGKVSEPFGETICEWSRNLTDGKRKRLDYLLSKLQLEDKPIDSMRYQLLHRTASALIEAEKFNAPNALMLVHSFSKTDEWLDDYRQFVALFGLQGEADAVVGPRTTDGIDLYFGWVRGDPRFREK